VLNFCFHTNRFQGLCTPLQQPLPAYHNLTPRAHQLHRVKFGSPYVKFG
jgi:hypothetical protein